MSETNPPERKPLYIDWDEVARWRAVPPAERMAVGLRIHEQKRKMIMEDLRMEYPQATEDEIKAKYVEIMYGSNPCS